MALQIDPKERLIAYGITVHMVELTVERLQPNLCSLNDGDDPFKLTNSYLNMSVLKQKGKIGKMQFFHTQPFHSNFCNERPREEGVIWCC
jgi:hypothetical protein